MGAYARRQRSRATWRPYSSQLADREVSSDSSGRMPSFNGGIFKGKKSVQQMIAEVDLQTFLRSKNLRQQQKARIHRQRSCEEERESGQHRGRRRNIAGQGLKEEYEIILNNAVRQS